MPVDLQKHMVPPRPQKEPTVHFLNSDAEPPDRETTDLVVLRRSACGALLTAAQASPGAETFPHDSGEASWLPASKCRRRAAAGNTDLPTLSHSLCRKLLFFLSFHFAAAKS